MTTTGPWHEEDGIVVVQDGLPRLRWVRESAGWRLSGLWPDAGERAVVEQRLEARLPMLVLLTTREPVTAVTESELAGAQPGTSPFEVTWSGAVGEVAVPLLDWLPDALRARGLAHRENAVRELAAHPRALRPDVLLDDGGGPVVFAAARRLPEVREAVAIAREVFAGALA